MTETDTNAAKGKEGGRLDVVGLGYCAYDILAIVPRLPDFDDVKMTHLPELVFDGGGPVGTALATLARLGAGVGYVGLLGEEQASHWLMELFVEEGVDVSRLRLRSDVGANICLILVEQATGRRSILCHRRVRLEDLILEEADRRYIQAARVLHLDGQFMPAAIQAARWMREAGGKVCFDGNHPRRGMEELLPLVDWLVVAEAFPEQYTGLSDPEAAAGELLGLGPEVLIVTQGARGCRVWTEEERFCKPAFAVEVVDTTGAGDAFHGGFLYGMLQGWDLRRVAVFANAVAALNCRMLGGRRGLPTFEQVQRLMGAGPMAAR